MSIQTKANGSKTSKEYTIHFTLQQWDQISSTQNKIINLKDP